MTPAHSVYVDFDDVLCETARALLAEAGRRFGRRLAFEDIRSFDIGKAFDLAEEQVAEIMRVLHDPDVLETLPPMDGAREVLTMWADAGHAIAVVTGRPPSTARASRAWLARHHVPCDALIFVDKYGRFRDDAARGEWLALDDLRRQSFALAIDDSLDTALYLAEHTAIPVVLFDRPWNGAAPSAASARLVRCSGWADIARRFPDPAALTRRT